MSQEVCVCAHVRACVHACEHACNHVLYLCVYACMHTCATVSIVCITFPHLHNVTCTVVVPNSNTNYADSQIVMPTSVEIRTVFLEGFQASLSLEWLGSSIVVTVDR